jgi:hypothetical protein
MCQVWTDLREAAIRDRQQRLNRRWCCKILLFVMAVVNLLAIAAGIAYLTLLYLPACASRVCVLSAPVLYTAVSRPIGYSLSFCLNLSDCSETTDSPHDRCPRPLIESDLDVYTGMSCHGRVTYSSCRGKHPVPMGRTTQGELAGAGTTSLAAPRYQARQAIPSGNTSKPQPERWQDTHTRILSGDCVRRAAE